MLWFHVVLVLTVPEISTLEQQHSADLQTVSLNKLVLVQSFDAEGKLKKMGPPQVLWYNTSMNVLKMAKEMHILHHSSLVLSSWVKGAAYSASLFSAPCVVTLKQIYDCIWLPLMTDFSELSISIANANITFKKLDNVFVESGDQGDGRLIKKELCLMSEMLSESRGFKPEGNWVEVRLGQIQEYKQLCEVAAAASAILKIAQSMRLSGKFTEIDTLKELVTVLYYFFPSRSTTEICV